MSRNSALKVSLKIGEAVANSGIDRLDAELILASVLDKPREWIIAHSDEELGDLSSVEKVNTLFAQRRAGEPLAYVLGYREFYGRKFRVTKNVLIPRPETEELINIVKGLRLPGNFVRVLDVGTGSGVICVTLQCEFPEWRVTGSDINEKALKVAYENGLDLGVNTKLISSDLLSKIHGRFNLIVANLPYVSRDWEVSPEVKAEPDDAVYADDGGQKLIKKLIAEAPKSLYKDGFLLLELDPRQKNSIREYADKNHFRTVAEKPFALLLQLV
jgi:release factor glutamine methyltransferase